MSQIHDQADEVRGHLREALAKRAFGVDYGYDVAFGMAPVQTPQGPRMMPVYTLLITRRSPLIGGADLSHLAPIQHARPTFEMVDEQVAEGLRLLADLHTQ